MGKIIRDGNVISSYNYEKTVDQSDFINMITRPANVNIVVPEGITKIANNVFYNYTNLKEVTLPSSITSIENSAFYRCFDMLLTGNELPSSLTSIGSDAFNEATKVIISKIPAGVTVLNDRTFYDCKGLENLDLSHITRIGSGCFSYCSNLASVILSQELTSLGSDVFKGTKIVQIDLPIGVVTIPYRCFYDTPLMKAIFKGNIRTIESDAFYKCPSLSQFDLRNNTAVPTLYSVESLEHASGCKIVIPNSLYDTWTTATNWAGLTDVQWIRVINSWDDTITAEGDYVLMNDLDLTDIRHLTPSAPVARAPGLYNSSGRLVTSWNKLISDGVMKYENGQLNVDYDNYMQGELDGELVVPNLEGLTSLLTAFYECDLLTKIDTTALDTTNVNNFSSMYYRNTGLTEIDMSNFNMNNANYVQDLCKYCINVTKIICGECDTHSIIGGFTGMFYGCVKLKYLDVSKIDFNAFGDPEGTAPATIMFKGVPTDCEIIVKDDANKAWITKHWATLTNVKVKGA